MRSYDRIFIDSATTSEYNEVGSEVALVSNWADDKVILQFLSRARQLLPMKKFCENCDKEVSAKVVKRKEVFPVCGENTEVSAQVLVCPECGEEMFCEEFDSQTLVNAYNAYRMKHKLLLPDEIKTIREQYGLSQRSFAKLLNWGDKTIYRYEGGSLQDRAHNSMLLFLREPGNMRTYLAQNEVDLDERQKNKILNAVDKLESASPMEGDQRIFDLFFSSEPCEENGCKGFDSDKTYAMVLFFGNKERELLKSKLMILLYYADLLYYKENGVSMSGMKYIRAPYGPSPENYDILLGKMTADHVVTVDIKTEDGYEKHEVLAESSVPRNVLTKKEKQILECVHEKFSGLSPKEIFDFSCKQKPYASTKPGEYISYSYASDIHF